MASIQTSIEIAAPPEAVWKVLADYAAYPEWNPFIPELSGGRQAGEKLQVTIKPPKASSKMSFEAIIQTYTENAQIGWLGRLFNMPGIFTGQHDLILHKREDSNTTTFEQIEHFTGIVPTVATWVGTEMFQDMENGFRAMDEALKERVEARVRGGEQ